MTIACVFARLALGPNATLLKLSLVETGESLVTDDTECCWAGIACASGLLTGPILGLAISLTLVPFAMVCATEFELLDDMDSERSSYVSPVPVALPPDELTMNPPRVELICRE